MGRILSRSGEKQSECFQLLLTLTTLTKLKAAAKEQGMFATEFVRRAIEEKLKRDEENPPAKRDILVIPGCNIKRATARAVYDEAMGGRTTEATRRGARKFEAAMSGKVTA